MTTSEWLASERSTRTTRPTTSGASWGWWLFGYMTAEIDGIGTLYVTGIPVATPPVRIATTYLDPVINFDKEWLMNVDGERVAFKFEIAGLSETFSLRKLAVFAKLHPWKKIRGLLS